MDHDIWFYRAKQDWITIQAILAAPEKSWSYIAFHSQQAAEKCIKGFLSFKDKHPPRVHDLRELIAISRSFDPSLTELENDCKFLSQFASNARYEIFENEYDEAAAREAIAAAKRICSAMRERIPYDIPY